MNKVFLKRFDNIGPFEDGRWATMIEWCKNNLYHVTIYEPNWYAQYPTFYFKDEQEYILFVLRWA